MARFMTRYGMVDFPVLSNPKKRKGKGKKKARRKARASARKAAKKRTNPRQKKVCSKKVGRWRVEARGRTVYAAGAKHSYKTAAAACTAYKRLTSVKSVEGFVVRYGKKATKKVVAGVGKKKSTKRKSTRRNAPISASQAASMKAVLATHGNPRRKKRGRRNPTLGAKLVGKYSVEVYALDGAHDKGAIIVYYRGVYAHRSYKSLAAAMDRYRKLTTEKKIESWGESAGRKRNPSRKRKTAAHGNPSKWARLVKGKLPGDLIDTWGVSSSTIRNWRSKGWIKSSKGWTKSRGGGYYTLTQKGYDPTVSTAVRRARGNPKRRKARNAPLSAAEKRSLRAVLKKHGYLR